MKRQKGYIIGGLFLLTIIYTSMSFTFPTGSGQNASVIETALRLVESSINEIDPTDDYIREDAGFQILPIRLNQASSNNEDTKETAAVSTEETSIVPPHADSTVLPLEPNVVSSFSEVIQNSIAEKMEDPSITSGTAEIVTLSPAPTTSPVSTEDSKHEKQEDTKAESAKSKSSNKKSKAKKSKKAAKEQEVLTIMSIADHSCEGSDIGISVAESYVNIRKEPSTDSTILGKLYEGSACEVKKEKDGWLKITSGTVTGYVNSDYIKTDLTDEQLEKYGTLTATVDTDGLNVRAKADTDSKKIDVIYSGETYPVLKQGTEWAKIKITDDKLKGYVKLEYVDLNLEFPEAISIEEEIALQKSKETASQQSSSDITQGNATSSTTDEVKLLACLIQAEAGNQCYEGKLAVANVVLNRVHSSRYPNSISKVIYQSGQFGVASNGSLSKQLSLYSSFSSSSQKLSIQAAKDALAGSNNIGSRMYFNRYSSSLASRKGGNSVKIQDHLFW